MNNLKRTVEIGTRLQDMINVALPNDIYAVRAWSPDNYEFVVTEVGSIYPYAEGLLFVKVVDDELMVGKILDKEYGTVSFLSTYILSNPETDLEEIFKEHLKDATAVKITLNYTQK